MGMGQNAGGPGTSKPPPGANAGTTVNAGGAGFGVIDPTQGGLYPWADPTSFAGATTGYETGMPLLASAYLKNISGGLVNAPTFQEMYQSYKDVASQQAAQAGANITESLGSQGARYSSDLMRMQGQNQRDLATDLRAQASNFLLGLRGQQSQEVAGGLTYLQNRDIMGSQYLWQDYLRGTSPPPLLGAAATQPGQPPGPVSY